MRSTERTDIYTRVTNEIVAAIEAGADSWTMPWHHDGSATSRPLNAGTCKPYRGSNILSLWIAAQAPTVFSRLLAGAVAVSVFIVYAGDVWTQAAGDSIHILVSGGFERSILQPSFTLSYSGQMPGDEEGSAETPSPSHELNGQLSVKGEVERKGVGVGFAANIVGVSDRAEALRFSELGEDASKIDLASGLVEQELFSSHVNLSLVMS